MASDTHRYVGNHAQEINGVFVAPGDFVKLTKEQLDDPHNADMVKSGVLVDLKAWGSSVKPEGGEK